MSSKKPRQTMEKLRREQAVRKRREDKLQRKADARAAKAAGTEASTDPPAENGAGQADPTLPAIVEATKNGSGLREAPSPPVHEE
jgi:hypothetical protein